MSCSNKQMLLERPFWSWKTCEDSFRVKRQRGLFSTGTLKKVLVAVFIFWKMLKEKKTMFYVLFLHIYHFLTLNTCFNKLFTALFTLQLKKWAQLLTFFVLATKRPVVFMKKDTWWLRSYVFCTCPCFFFLTSYLNTKKEGVQYTL